MNYTLEQFIDEAVRLELHAAEIYALFSSTVPEDADFWAGLSWEERNHATLLKTGRDVLLPAEQFPGELLPRFIQSLIETNRWLQQLREEYAEAPPDRNRAFAVALKIENSAGEQHFQRIMATPADSKMMKILQELCRDDIHHLKRIKAYMRKVGLRPEKPSDAGKKILIVMADDSVAELLAAILETEGRVDMARNGLEGLQKVGEYYYHLIISAVDLPELDGLQFFREAQKISANLRNRFLFFAGAPTAEQISFFHDENLSYLSAPSTITEIRETAVQILA